MSPYRKLLLPPVLAASLAVFLMPSVHAVSAESAAGTATPWEVIDVNMKESMAAYRKGDQEAAYLLAVTAYLDGFELLEDRLKDVDYDLMKTIEQGMGQLRDLMRQGAPVRVIENQNGFVRNLLAQAKDAMGSAGEGAR
jgi:high-affinity iron transporter